MSDIPTVCIANIGPGERTKRLRFGIVSLSIGALIALVLIITGVSFAWRLPLFLVFFLGALGFFQARDRT